MPSSELLLSKRVIISFALTYVSVLVFLLLLGHYQSFYLIGWVALSIFFVVLFLPLFKDQQKAYPWLADRSDAMLRFLIFVVAFSLRAIFLFDIPSEKNGILSEDLLKYSNKARRVRNGQLPYRDFDTAYGPLHNYLIAIASFLATKGPDSKPHVWDYDLAVILMFKLLACTSDSINSILVLELGRLWKLNRDRAALCAFAYASNPVSIIEFGWSGHNDAIVIMFMLLSLYAFLRGNEHVSAILLAAGTAMKYWPGVFILLLVGSLLKKENGYRRSITYLIVYVVSIFLISLPYLLVAPVEFIVGVTHLVRGGGNIYDRLSLISLATDAVVKFVDQQGNRSLIKTSVCVLTYLVILMFILAFLFTRIRPRRLHVDSLFKSAHFGILILLLIWGYSFAVYAMVTESPLLIFGIAMFLISLWLLKEEWGNFSTIFPISEKTQVLQTEATSELNEPFLEAIFWTGFFLVLFNATYHAWYYTWFLPVFFIVLGKVPSYRRLLFLILIHIPTSYVTTDLYFRGFLP